MPDRDIEIDQENSHGKFKLWYNNQSSLLPQQQKAF